MSAWGTSIAFSPLLPWLVLGILGGVGAAAFVLGLVLRARGALLRGVAIALLWLILANPSLIVEKREPIRDVVVVVVDESDSQNLGKRRARTKAALEHIRSSLRRFGDIDIKVVRGGSRAGIKGRLSGDGTILFGPLERTLSEIPRQRLAGVIMITDGQVHDVPVKGRMIRGIGPFHVLLSGDRNEGDRRLVVENAPAFGLIGKPLRIKVRVEDNAAAPGSRARIVIKRDGKPWRSVSVPVGRSTTLNFQLGHPSTTFFELEVAKGARELTLDNNRAVVAINGIRDRLRVLLISGEPHPGERSWRNLLKSDPAVDLVHFTILRPPDKRDATPVNELALISFPVRELFQVKLKEFDLIIFDRYRRRGVILSRYLRNIVRYVREGGALLVAVGPSFANRLSLHHTPIGQVLPSRPTGDVVVRGFRAALNDKGRRHPVTATLPGAATEGDKAWGRWFRQIGVSVKGGDVLMTGADGRPLLILDRVGKGRVAQFLSDQAWLWGRGFDGGGPQAEMLRRVAHWLMKEPELEENALSGRIRGGRLHISRRSLNPTKRPVTVTTPAGEKRTVTLKDIGGGRATGSIPLKLPGVYRMTDGKLNAMTAVGSLNPKEFAEVRTTAAKLGPVIAANTGSVTWLGNDGNPELRRVAPGRDVAGRNRLGGNTWIGLKRTGQFTVTGIREVPLLVGLIALLIVLLPLIGGWWREGK